MKNFTQNIQHVVLALVAAFALSFSLNEAKAGEARLGTGRYILGASLATISPIALGTIAYQATRPSYVDSEGKRYAYGLDANEVFLPMLWAPSLGVGQFIQGRWGPGLGIATAQTLGAGLILSNFEFCMYECSSYSNSSDGLLAVGAILYVLARVYEVSDAWFGPIADGSLEESLDLDDNTGSLSVLPKLEKNKHPTGLELTYALRF